MALSEVQICNMAISNVGARSSIESFDERSTEAAQCKLWFDYSRRQALEAHDWSFARKRAALVLHADAAPTGIWLFRYVYPTDCISAREIENLAGPNADALPFEVELGDDGETKSILTDTEDARLIYTFNQTNPGLYTPLFVELLSWILASHIAMSLTGKVAMADRATARASELSRIAPALAANERVDRAPRDAEHIRGRV